MCGAAEMLNLFSKRLEAYLNQLCPSCGNCSVETAYDERARAESLDEIEARLLLEKKEAEKCQNCNGKLFCLGCSSIRGSEAAGD